MSRISFTGLVPDLIRENGGAYSRWLGACVEQRGFGVSRISYFFVDNKESKSLNRSLLNHDYATDIITLNHSRGKRLRVELYLGREIIEENAQDLGSPFEEELARVLAHGLLHCMGWDDQTEEERQAMRKEEEICLISRPVLEGK